jgi:hypothetical protein
MSVGGPEENLSADRIILANEGRLATRPSHSHSTVKSTAVDPKPTLSLRGGNRSSCPQTGHWRIAESHRGANLTRHAGTTRTITMLRPARRLNP